MPGGRESTWTLALSYGRPKRRQLLLLAYTLPFLLIIAALAYAVVKEGLRADVVFDRLEARLRAAGGAANVDEALIRSVADYPRVAIEIYDLQSSTLVASNVRQTANLEGVITLRFEKRVRPFGRLWLLRQTRANPTRQILTNWQTLTWVVLILLPLFIWARPSRRRRSFDLEATMLDHLIDVIAVIDLAGTIVYVSPSVTRSFGHAPQDVLGRKLRDFIDPDDWARVSDTLERAKASDVGETFADVCVRDAGDRWHHVEGTSRRITVRGKPLATLMTMHDVSAVVNAHDAQWVSEERFRRLFEAITDYAIAILDPSGRVVSWNPGAERMTGYSAEEIIGQSIDVLRPAEMRDPAVLASELAAAAENGRYEGEAWRVRKDGTRFLAQVIRAPMIDRMGRLTGFSSITRDVTERRMVEEQLSQAQRLDSLGKLAGGIAHDFNNMLMVIFSRVDLLLLPQLPPEKVKRSLEDIRSAAAKSADLTQQLLAAARRQVLKPEVVDINEVVRSTMRLLASTIGEDIAIRLQLDARSLPVYADPGKLHQVLMNLALNARDAMPDGGVLTIETRHHVADGEYTRRHPQLTTGRYVLVVVSDSGVGIPSEIQARIYDPFFSTKQGGTGLGLAVVRGIVEQTGGHIWVYSEVGKGTTFRIFFPSLREEESAEAAPAAPEHHAGAGTETILLVEDEELVRTIVREALEEQGYRVIEAGTGKEALSEAQRHEETIHLLLTDVVMPGMSGKALAEQMRAERPDVQVIFMSGYTDDVVVHHGVLDAQDRFLEKPVARDKLLHTVRAVLDARKR